MSPLFTLQCRHGYFADGVCRALSLAPTPNCAQLLARYRLRFQPLPGGGTVHYEDGASPLAQFTESAPLAFWLISRDPALSDYTDVAGKRAAGLFYFDNLHCEPETETGSTLSGGPLAVPCLPARPPRFGLPVDPPRRAARLELFGPLPGAVPVWQAQSPDASLAALPLDFGALDEGRYRLNADGVQLLDFWLGNPPANAWGVAAIYLGGPRLADSVPAAACAIGRTGEISVRTYGIELTARSLLWRYHLIGRSEMNFANYQLVANRTAGGPVHFDGAPGDPVAGQPSYCFTAREPLALAERPGDTVSVQLASLLHARPQLSVNLAYPRPGNVSGAQDGQQFADVFVYL
ncbi:hypothetical protein FAZ69_13260 [Trinickia terrae]|uniref:Uncharacterized protein n=1 Tax=Trinickia terrae TaxID=2571161 RepID=A0A4U1I691_9BURK|nr:hypothetical protein [Trinickia terrae]TKC88715.1 hypothetical protein FAZ69_13260 [Trinickia terrae]